MLELIGREPAEVLKECGLRLVPSCFHGSIEVVYRLGGRYVARRWLHGIQARGEHLL